MRRSCRAAGERPCITQLPAADRAGDVLQLAGEEIEHIVDCQDAGQLPALSDHRQAAHADAPHLLQRRLDESASLADTAAPS
jgi:hypothetical protein